MKERSKLTSSRWGVDGFPAVITPLPTAPVIGFFFNARGFFGGSVVSGGFGSSQTTSVCVALLFAGPEISCPECTSSSLT
jgi:hypothetical protein